MLRLASHPSAKGMITTIPFNSDLIRVPRKCPGQVRSVAGLGRTPCTSGIMRLRAGAALLLLVHSAHSEYYLCSGGYEPVGEKCIQLTGSGYTFDECATSECPKRGGHILAGIAFVLFVSNVR